MKLAEALLEAKIGGDNVIVDDCGDAYDLRGDYHWDVDELMSEGWHLIRSTDKKYTLQEICEMCCEKNINIIACCVADDEYKEPDEYEDAARCFFISPKNDKIIIMSPDSAWECGFTMRHFTEQCWVAMATQLENYP